VLLHRTGRAHHSCSCRFELAHEHLHRLERLIPHQPMIDSKTDQPLIPFRACISGYNSLLLVNHRESHIRDDPPCYIVLVVKLYRRHESHQSSHPGMHKRIFQTPRKSGYENLFLGIRPQERGESAEQDAGVCPDRGFGVDLHLGE
jgi:hypothetical protein